MTVLFYSLTIFTSAFLLFLIQPLFAKMILPLLGGSASVWNTCLVFYQGILLAGYGYTHWACKALSLRRILLLHAVILLLPFFVLPISIPQGWVPSNVMGPNLWLLTLLLTAIGLPFFAVSTLSPLMQKLFTLSGHKDAQDPYFLYAASNAGSLLALLGYPFLMESWLTLSAQSAFWTRIYFILLLLILLCFVLIRGGVPREEKCAEPQQPPAKKISKWVLLSFIPSSLLLGVTTFISTDIASVPLLWILPLAVYLLSFIFVFARRVIITHAFILRLFPFVVLSQAVLIATDIWNTNILLLISWNLMTLFVLAMVFHGELAKDRPAAAHLTAFYFWISVGGVLGGGFNAVLAPLIFNRILEYPLILIAACLAYPGYQAILQEKTGTGKKINARDLLIPAGIALFIFSATYLIRDVFHMDKGRFFIIAAFGLPAAICWLSRARPIRFGLCVGTLLLIGILSPLGRHKEIYRERSFFGVSYVYVKDNGDLHTLTHGTTIHGRQFTDPKRQKEPLSYYGKQGPLGQVMRTLYAKPGHKNIAAIGLGVGAIAAYAQPGDHWTFYEIDPAVNRIANNPKLFTYLKDCGNACQVIMGDGRLSIAKEPNAKFDLIVLDAFSSDSIPVHLLTREALRLYASKLKDDGLIAAHITNRHINLFELFAALAKDMGFVFASREDILSEAQIAQGLEYSKWAVLVRSPHHLGEILKDSRWLTVGGSWQAKKIWTDQFSNILHFLDL